MIILNIIFVQLNAQKLIKSNQEKFRPQIHFTPEKNWVNDPNGMIFYNGTYHLFFQHSPNASVWKDISWGHATSKDLVNWTRKPIAIYPDSLGLIFSGSVVFDKFNTSGLGKNGVAPLVAIYTQHDMLKEKSGRNDFQNQSIAFSLDGGEHWNKYVNNPVLKSPGIRDFRDPKVFWNKSTNKWIMSLAVVDHISFYSSKDLINWTKESDFGTGLGNHGGVWECPDLFPLKFEGKQLWALLVNTNPGGPNKGSATQYFIGNFDGKKFVPYSTDEKWIDYGPDEYAGVTWENTANKKYFIGWMSNWMYANIVPTEKWRNSFTLTRELSIGKFKNDFIIKSNPISAIKSLEVDSEELTSLISSSDLNITNKIKNFTVPSKIEIEFEKNNDVIVCFENQNKEQLKVGFDDLKNQFFIDRTKSGITDFHKDFATVSIAPRLCDNSKVKMTLYLDKSSIELYADDGSTVMTSIIFPNSDYNTVNLSSKKNSKINKLKYFQLKSIW